jgi:hypothetical protein
VGTVTVTLSEKSRVFFVVECFYTPGTAKADIGYLVSMPGRPDPVGRTWRCPHGIPTESQVNDMTAFVTKLVYEATVSFCGAQRDLDLS